MESPHNKDGRSHRATRKLYIGTPAFHQKRRALDMALGL